MKIVMKEIKDIKDMTIKEYQESTQKTAVYPRIEWFESYKDNEKDDESVLKYVSTIGWTYPIIGLTGEVGELSNKLKKVIRDNKGKIKNPDDLADEIGDIMWYISQLCNELGLNLEEIMELNIKKLSDRKKRNKLHGSGDKR